MRSRHTPTPCTLYSSTQSSCSNGCTRERLATLKMTEQYRKVKAVWDEKQREEQEQKRHGPTRRRKRERATGRWRGGDKGRREMVDVEVIKKEWRRNNKSIREEINGRWRRELGWNIEKREKGRKNGRKNERKERNFRALYLQTDTVVEWIEDIHVVLTDDSRLLQESNLTARQPRREPQ